jgi:hypothetical protein
MCDLENLVNEEAIAREWAAAPHEKKILLFKCHIHVGLTNLQNPGFIFMSAWDADLGGNVQAKQTTCLRTFFGTLQNNNVTAVRNLTLTFSLMTLTNEPL